MSLHPNPYKKETRRYCEVCNCWTGNNKASIEFHESGQKHKENVEKRIRDSRKSHAEKLAKEKEEKKILEEVEKAALKALERDQQKAPTPTAVEAAKELDVATHQPHSTESSYVDPNGWAMAVTHQGHTYFYNIRTLETTWHRPHGYIDEAAANAQHVAASKPQGKATKPVEEEAAHGKEGARPQEAEAKKKDEPLSNEARMPSAWEEVPVKRSKAEASRKDGDTSDADGGEPKAKKKKKQKDDTDKEVFEKDEDDTYRRLVEQDMPTFEEKKAPKLAIKPGSGPVGFMKKKKKNSNTRRAHKSQEASS